MRRSGTASRCTMRWQRCTRVPFAATYARCVRSGRAGRDASARPLRVSGAAEQLEAVGPSIVVRTTCGDNAELFDKIEFSEKQIEINLGDGVTVSGRIDLVRRIDTGETTIVDLKSTDRAQPEEVTETQLHIYALGYQELTGRKPTTSRSTNWTSASESRAPWTTTLSKT